MPIDSILDIVVSFFSVADYAYACVDVRAALINWIKLTQGEQHGR